ncbi:cation efflux family-domain-containing protein [Ampelomyces quisqualis]|uniref:Cation efflux family-domain-containing protein n=1 Tax=Ampelomyces quisqualis TaxID=50730 RepID=A0A6A5QFF4_AMPQU|nr:cation efflux family-domain-containing protein [Ampelomyces quisqualis]
MLLRPGRDGMCVVFTHIRATPAPSRVARCALSLPPETCRQQLRVLQTCSRTKGAQYPRTTALPLNWSSTVHRIRHVPPAAMTTQTQTRAHAGHSHHHHHHDNTFLLSKNKSDAGVRITRIGLYVNLGMAVSKGFGGYVFNSQALLADAIHSLTDLVSDVLTLATVGWSLKPPSERFPSGYGKIESLGALGVSGILLGGGFLMGWTALIALCQQFFPGAAEVAAHWGLLPHSHGHHHGAGDLGPNINAAWLAAGSIVIKEWLYRATLKVANERKSAVLASNAYHHRVDSLTAFVALLLITGSNLLNNAQWLDPVGGLVISLMVVQAGWGNTKQALLELADVGVEKEMKDNVRKAATKAVESIATSSEPVNVRAIQGVKAGQNYLMDVELGVPGTWTVEQTRGVEDLVRERIGAKVRGVKKVRVRFVSNTAEEPDFLDEFIPGDPGASLRPVEDDHDYDHDHDHDHDHGQKHAQGADGSARRRK